MRTLFIIILSFGFLVAHAQYKPKTDRDFLEDRHNILKINTWALLNGSGIISYEKALRYRNSIKFEFKYIGLFDKGYFENFEGFGMNIGYKIKYKDLTSVRTINQTSHIFSGGYFQPNIGFIFFAKEDYSLVDTEYGLFNVGIDLGRQWVYKNRITFDFSIGWFLVLGDVIGSTDIYTLGDSVVAYFAGSKLGVQIGYLFGRYKKSGRHIREEY